MSLGPEPNHRPHLWVRAYGRRGPRVIVLHGGPAAAGEAGPLARGLADGFRVLEPWQRESGAEPCTVAAHVSDLSRLIRTRCDGERPALVGESWGAMLALAFASSHPEQAGPLVLVGCGTFDPEARSRFLATLEERIDPVLRRRLSHLSEEWPDPEECLRKRVELTRRLYDYDPIDSEGEEAGKGEGPGPPPEGDAVRFDLRAHQETWADMLRLQGEGVYPAAFAAIRSPVLMLHGAHDPHPGRMIREGLKGYLPQLEYREWEKCGHQPWREREVREEFFQVLREWLVKRA